MNDYEKERVRIQEEQLKIQKLQIRLQVFNTFLMAGLPIITVLLNKALR